MSLVDASYMACTNRIRVTGYSVCVIRAVLLKMEDLNGCASHNFGLHVIAIAVEKG